MRRNNEKRSTAGAGDRHCGSVLKCSKISYNGIRTKYLENSICIHRSRSCCDAESISRTAVRRDMFCKGKRKKENKSRFAGTSEQTPTEKKEQLFVGRRKQRA